ncbi:radical SAM/SPASM domain-containing protein [Ruminiclostridium josui]|uniref:radical SAM/SPASM domain-containing protein n=1 Tax=Ruminiclostridium josui TaxID=1499 RepID=UPI000467DC7A|nr:radical SAM protein [Ruminiclostridium josui]
MKHLYKNSNKYYLLDSGQMRFYVIPDNLSSLLDTYNSQELDKAAKQFNLPGSEEHISEIIKEDPQKCKRLILNISEVCNLSCKYCYAHGGNYKQDSYMKNMSLDTLKKVVARTCELYPHGISQIQFFGGEPLLNKEVLFSGVEWIENYFKSLGLDCPIFTMVTNGTLIDEKCIAIFNKYFESVTLSLDGSKQVNDQKRIYKDDPSSVYERVVDVINLMNKDKREFYICIEGTIHEGHIREFEEKKSMESFIALKNLGADIIHISPLIGDTGISCDCGKAYCDFFEAWVKEEFKSGIENTKTRTVASLLYAAKQRKAYGNGCGATETDLATDVDGKMYPCFMFIGEQKFSLGYAFDDLALQQEKLLSIRELLRQANDNTECNNCWVKPICSKTYGHCIGARYLTNGDISRPIKEVCDISKCVIENIFVESYNMYGIKR